MRMLWGITLTNRDKKEVMCGADRRKTCVEINILLMLMFFVSPYCKIFRANKPVT
jgi:hypothetical protein